MAPTANPSSIALVCQVAVVRAMPCACTRYGTPQRPANVSSVPASPMFAKKPGHEQGLRMTSSSPVCQGGWELVRGCGKFMRRGEPHVLRPVVHEEPAENGEDDRHQTSSDEHGAPRYHGHQPRERRRGQDRAHVAEEDRHAGHGGELALAEPLGDELQQCDEHDRYAEPDQGATDRGHGERRRGAEGHRTGAGDEPAHGDDAARAEPVDQHAGRDLHHGVDVEIGRCQHTEGDAARVERPAPDHPQSRPARRDGRRRARRRPPRSRRRTISVAGATRRRQTQRAMTYR